MSRGHFPEIPNEDELAWVESSLKYGRHSFWSLVDSTPHGSSIYKQGCTCRHGGDERHCTYWPHVRSDEWCVAANSALNRCHQRAYEGTPFCSFHLDRAWTLLLHAADRTMRELWARRQERLLAEHEANTDQLLLSLNIARHQQWDAATAASQLKERVYFFLAGDAVKVGRSVRPERRVRTLGNTKAPEGINVATGRLLGHIPGSHHVEGHLHGRFDRHRLVGEWFTYEPIADDIAALLAEQANLEGATS